MQTSTVPYLIDNPEVGYVQARWTFANPDESYLTKVSFRIAACWLPPGRVCSLICAFGISGLNALYETPVLFAYMSHLW